MGYILLWLNVSLTFSTQIRFPSCLKLMSTWRRRTGLSLTYPWTAVFKGKKINKKREKIKRRCRILHNPPVALFAAASVLYSANESHQRASSSPTTHVLSSEETRAARCLFTFFFQPDSVQTSHNKSTGSPKLLLSTCSTQTSSHSDVHDCRFLLLVPNRERKPD